MAKETKNQILAIAKSMELQPILGALGETPCCLAYVEQEITTENGWETKYFGIATPFKGKIDNDIIDRVTITKRAFKMIIQLWPIRISRIVGAFLSIYRAEGGLKSRCLKPEEFCPACRELIRAGKKIFKVLEDLVYCLAMFLQFSPAYRFRFQDGAGLLNKDNLKKSFLKELWRVRKIMLEREHDEKKKMRMLLNLFILLAIIKRKAIYDFLMELDIDKVKLDSDDFYYCLRRTSYNFGGISFEVREAIAQAVDTKLDNVVLGI